ncbi:arsinothricin resistance N-acetyltransferase ArsN1 family B [Phytoactinopolyspora halotolerans]|uniref:N-acetyltransferase n=1 Tax=Phytoactinopolyspora halotolerans TaxID=1981512 RepID=A0A6L9SKM2_9ACTN|nr:arsinothricin resistance N-acetyltransferase ArsN1 family B [Phytoactinopolyspora halotolerans]NEE04660.1 N-acetyltransferase [Phytoactinopolyspora halotolerans]
MMDLVIRDATEDDAAACAAIYAPYVTDTAISFELEPPTADEMAERITAANKDHAWLVAEDAGRTIGYAYATTFSARAAYRWSCTTSIYLELGRHRKGVGRTLYQALLDRLTDLGYRQALAGMTLPNDASAGLHRALGFEPVGTYRQVGWKYGQWRDVAWTQKTLPTTDGPPRPTNGTVV